MRHLQRETVVDLSGRDPARLSFAAFYADCQHETRPVREGHRVALVFNLALRGAGAPVGAPDFSELEKQIAKVLRPWSESAKDGEKFVWLLEHDYSTSGLSFATLKGKDATVARTLAAAAARAGCSTHAAIACITEYGSGSSGWYGDDGEIEMDHVEDWECVLESWAAPDGTRPNYGRLPLEDGELLPNRALDDADPDQKRIEEASGNSGATIEHVYRNAALVPWPRARTLETLLTAGIAGAAEYGKR